MHEIGREGCLSIPDLTANVRRATRIEVEHAGGSVESVGFEARCIQHEIDHLDGVLFLDRVASLVDDVFRRKRYAEGAGGVRRLGRQEAGLLVVARFTGQARPARPAGSGSTRCRPARRSC